MDIVFECSDDYKLRLPNGEIIKDSCIYPNFAEEMGIDIDEVWKKCISCPEQPNDKPLEYSKDGMIPLWVNGTHKALNYRGNAIKRGKMWFQPEYSKGYRKYGYTGWQWKITYAKRDIKSLPVLENLAYTVNNSGLVDIPFNDWIVTRYRDGSDNIGFHSDKIRDFTKDSVIMIIKLGDSRKFEFTYEDKVFYSEILPKGTAIFTGLDCNKKVKHGVPVMKDVGLSGSIVGRCIDTIVPWDKVKKEIEKRSK